MRDIYDHLFESALQVSHTTETLQRIIRRLDSDPDAVVAIVEQLNALRQHADAITRAADQVAYLVFGGGAIERGES